MTLLSGRTSPLGGVGVGVPEGGVAMRVRVGLGSLGSLVGMLMMLVVRVQVVVLDQVVLVLVRMGAVMGVLVGHLRSSPLGENHCAAWLQRLDISGRLLSVDDPAAAAAWLDAPDTAMLDANLELVRPHCSLDDLPQRIVPVLRDLGLPVA